MGVLLSFNCRDEHLPEIQRIVKRFDMRFVSNPAAGMGWGGVFVEIADNGVSPAAWNAAMREIDAIRNPQPVEIQRKGILARIFG